MNRFDASGVLTRNLVALAAALLVPALLFTAVQVAAFDRGFYQQRFEALEISAHTGVPIEDLRRAMDQLLQFVAGEADSIYVTVSRMGRQRLAFDLREQLHMADVRTLYRNFVLFRNGAFALAVLAALLVLRRRERWAVLVSSGGTCGFSLVLAALAALALWVLLDFGSFWIAFHELLFTNDLWLLDPQVSLMIQMLPLELFSALVFRVLTLTLLLLSPFVALVLWCRLLQKRGSVSPNRVLS